MVVSKRRKMNNPKVSIIVPCYNQAQYLEDALQSILGQTCANWECIIVNDGSPDETERIAQKWVEKDPRFVYLYKENGGLSSARNFGLIVAKGDYIQFLDCDDLIEVKKLEAQINHLEKNPDLNISVSGYRYFDCDRNNIRILGRNNFIHEVVFNRYDKDVKEVFNIQNPMVISAPLFRKKDIDMIGYFNEKLSGLEDWDFNFRCALHNFSFEHIGYSENTKTLIRLHNKSMMSDSKKINEQVLIFKEYITKTSLYLSYFGNKMSEVKVKRHSIKSIIKQFIPPIFLKAILLCKIK
jgi:glycosyltransferase involved in cell wall biosynthesis